MEMLRRINLRSVLLVGAFVILGAVAVAGWARKTPATNDAVLPSNNAAYTQTTPDQRDQYGQPIVPAANNANNPCIGPNPNTPNPTSNEAVYQPATYAPGEDQYYATHYIYDIHRPVIVRAPAVQQDYVAPPPVVEQAPAYNEGSSDRMIYHDTHHNRSLKKSIAIVGGTAAVGAGIGAIAGGGKGAGIGALAGGAGGFIYDRLTHRH